MECVDMSSVFDVFDIPQENIEATRNPGYVPHFFETVAGKITRLALSVLSLSLARRFWIDPSIIEHRRSQGVKGNTHVLNGGKNEIPVQNQGKHAVQIGKMSFAKASESATSNFQKLNTQEIAQLAKKIGLDEAKKVIRFMMFEDNGKTLGKKPTSAFYTIDLGQDTLLCKITMQQKAFTTGNKIVQTPQGFHLDGYKKGDVKGDHNKFVADLEFIGRQKLTTP